FLFTVKFVKRVGLDPYLPEETIEEILLRLPHESLITFKLVSKSWYNLIKSDYFIRKNLDHHHHNNATITTALILARNSDFPSFIKSPQHIIPISWVNHIHDHDHSLRIHSLKQLNLPPNPSELLVKGLHCNGIICFPYKYKSKIIFCNPTLRQCKILDTPVLPKFLFIAHGFGYDKRTNLYKYVMISLSTPSNSNSTFRVQICSLSTTTSSGSSNTWREIDIEPYKNVLVSPHHEGVYFKSFYYWIIHGIKIKGIISFDMCSEKFSIISPPQIEEKIYRPIKLTVWKEELVLFTRNRESLLCVPSFSLDMWVNNGSNSWRKHLTISLTEWYVFYSPLDFWNHEELLIKPSNEAMVSYNIRTKKIRRLDISKYWSRLTLYSKSLVSFNN
ncbi:F-box protein At3g08750-like, partial [Cannabis sativa]|uniref:F-box protein At3g08750-like n=1 Tax=Cannabis sativa TaxID=3483 RepID=UPI0029CA3BAB